MHRSSFALALAGIALALSCVTAFARPSPSTAIRLSGGKAIKQLELCGARRSATAAGEGARIVSLVKTRSHRRGPVLRVDRCRNGRWTGTRRVRARRRGRAGRRSRTYAARIGTSGPADLRIRLRGHRPAYLRVGVGEIADAHVHFTVDNVNRSAVPCPADGKRYTVSGHIVGPAARIRDGAATTLYLHGAAVPEPTWRMPVTGYDWGAEQARRGHVSVTIDRLGYGSSSTPPGLLVCHGGQADIAHQVVTQLRAGTYRSPAAVRFARVALAGHSAGQVVAEIAAYSFGDIDALVVGGWGDPAPPPDDLAVLLPTIASCAGGGEPKRPAGPAFYAFTFKDRVPELLFHNADDRVIAAYIARHERDPCDVSLGSAPIFSALLLPRVQVPVFLFYGLNDRLWPAGTGARQRRLFTGTDDLTLFELPDAGHMMMLGRTAPAFQARASEWLSKRGF